MHAVILESRSKSRLRPATDCTCAPERRSLPLTSWHRIIESIERSTRQTARRQSAGRAAPANDTEVGHGMHAHGKHWVTKTVCKYDIVGQGEFEMHGYGGLDKNMCLDCRKIKGHHWALIK